MKRTVIISTVCIMMLLSANKLLGQSFSVNGINYSITSSSTVTVTGGTYSSNTLVIPDVVNYNGDVYAVTTMGDWIFMHCNGLTSIIIGDSLKSIGSWTFMECNDLRSLTIGSSLTSVGSWTFEYCSNLTEMYIKAMNPPSAGGWSFLIPNTATVHVPCGRASVYQGWRGLTTADILPFDIHVQSNNAVMGTANITQSNTCSNDTATIEATANISYRFAFWDDGNTDNPRKIKLTSDTISMAVFSTATSGISCVLGTVNNSNKGAVTGSGDYPNNTVATIEAIPNTKYRFLRWNDNNTTNPRMLTVTRDTLLIAYFDIIIDTVHLGTAGTLNSLSNIKHATCLTITGFIDARDIQFMRDSMIFLTDLDITNATIVGYSGNEGTRYGNNVTYPANEMPVYSFYNPNTGTIKTALTSVKLPISLISIGENAFRNCFGLISVTIDNSVTNIGTAAFENCYDLSSVTIPNSTKTIGANAFRSCVKLTSIAIPNLVTSIGNEAFRDCSGLISASLGNSVKTIGDAAFYFCSNLASVNIPDSVTYIGANAFRSCAKLTSITISDSVTYIGNEAFRDCSGLTFASLGNSVKTIGDAAFYFCSNLAFVNIPDSVTYIGANAFRSCVKLTLITIPDMVTSIGNETFRDCSGLTSASLGNSVKTIGDAAFYFCSNLASVNIPDSVTYIGANAFRSCAKLTLITIPDMVTSIGNETFRDCSGLTSAILGNSVKTIGDGAFYSCSNLASVNIPDSVTTIGANAFRSCAKLTSITIPNLVTSIGNETFRDCSGLTFASLGNSVKTIGGGAFYSCSNLSSITIPHSVTTIGNSPFAYCFKLPGIAVDLNNSNYISDDGVLINKLQTVLIQCPAGKTGYYTIPNTVTTLKYDAFAGCSVLDSVTIGSSVTTIEEYAFIGCSGLKTIINLNLVPQNISYNVFYSVNTSACILRVPTASVTDYQNTSEWQYFTIVGGGLLFSAKGNIATLGNITANIPDGIYPNNTPITLKATPVSSSFLGWTNGAVNISATDSLSFILTQDTVIIANFGNVGSINLTTAGTLNTQADFTLITHLTLTGNIDARDIRFIRDSIPLLSDLDLTDATIVEYIGKEGTEYGYYRTYPANEMPVYSLISNTYLTSVSIPNSVTTIGYEAFYNCRKLVSVNIGNSVTTIGNYAFGECYGLTSVIIPHSVTTIGEGAFVECHSLASVSIGNSVMTIGYEAFYNCRKLVSVNISNSVTTIGNYAFGECYSLTSVIIPHSVTTIGEGAFYYCTGLTSATIPHSVKTIGYDDF
jgi:hypothetical protein